MITTPTRAEELLNYIMAKLEYKSIDHYHKAFPAEIAQRMQQIRDAVHKVVPDAEEVISYNIPCFKYDGWLVYYSAYTGHISLSYPYSKQFLAEFAEELKAFKVSKSAIQFPNDEKFPIALITKMIRFRKKENEVAPKKKK
jgi:uncharacterized protein YdhG (YjbR/CyaY superfamily)